MQNNFFDSCSENISSINYGLYTIYRSLSYSSLASSRVNVLLTPIIGAVFAFFFSQYLGYRNGKNDLLKDFLSDLDDIEDLVTTYWLSEYKKPKVKYFLDDRYVKFSVDDELDLIGHQLRVKISNFSNYTDILKKLMSEKNFLDFCDLDGKLFEYATGGKFQTLEMQKSPEQYNLIMDVMSGMRILIRKERIHPSFIIRIMNFFTNLYRDILSIYLRFSQKFTSET